MGFATLTPAGADPVLEFGGFRLDRYRREFIADGRPAALVGRALGATSQS